MIVVLNKNSATDIEC